MAMGYVNISTQSPGYIHIAKNTMATCTSVA